MDTTGRHIGVRRPEPAPKQRRGPLLALALGVTLAVVAWGYLVYVAIDLGTAARGGDSHAWLLLGVATVGAIACLFVGLLLVVRLLDRLRALKATDRSDVHENAGRAPRNPGGRRASR